MRRIAVLDAPSNLGLRPPTATSVPGCAKAPGALRDHGLLTRLGARDAGCLTPPRYDPGDWRPGDGVAHAAEIAAYSRALADRIGAILDADEFPVVLGGDCSILLGSGLAMHRLGEAVGGRIGLVFVDGHSDFRHPGNASYVGAAAGEDLALVTGRGQSDLAAIEGRRPYFRDIDVVVLGIRAQDEYRLDLQAAGIVTRPVPALRAEGAARSAQWARDQLVDCAGYWLHVDVDVLDPAVMPAVDAPSPGGIAFPELELLLAGLVESPHCLGVEITVYDPDYDADGQYAAEITSSVATGLAVARTVTPRPDLIAARADLARPTPKAQPAGEPPAAAAKPTGAPPPASPTETAEARASVAKPSSPASSAAQPSSPAASAAQPSSPAASAAKPATAPSPGAKPSSSPVAKPSAFRASGAKPAPAPAAEPAVAGLKLGTAADRRAAAAKRRAAAAAAAKDPAGAAKSPAGAGEDPAGAGRATAPARKAAKNPAGAAKSPAGAGEDPAGAGQATAPARKAAKAPGSVPTADARAGAAQVWIRAGRGCPGRGRAGGWIGPARMPGPGSRRWVDSGCRGSGPGSRRWVDPGWPRIPRMPEQGPRGRSDLSWPRPRLRRCPDLGRPRIPLRLGPRLRRRPDPS